MTDGNVPYDDDLVPDVGGDSDWPDLVGYIKATVPLRTGYSAFVPKSNGIGRPVSGGKETFIRCPSPTHIDKKPSAWMQENEGLWYCSGCHIGGDIFDLAAFATGHMVPDYKADATEFSEVVEEVADRLGITEEQARAAGYTVEQRPLEAADVSPEWPEDFSEADMAEAFKLMEAWESSGVPNAKDLAVRDVVARKSVERRNVEIEELPAEPVIEEATSRELDIALAGLLDPNTNEVAANYDEALYKGLLVEVGMDPTFPHVDWQEIIPPDTPIGRMLKAVCVTDIPDEYFIWSIYTALGSMVGRRVELANNRGAVDPALWTVIIGATGSSKSTVAMEMDRVLDKVAPPVGSDGVRLVAVPASGEKFLDMIRREEMVASTVTGIPEMVECKNSANFMYSDEFSLLGAILARAGSTLTSLLLQAYGVRRDYVLKPPESITRIVFEVTGPMLSILSTTQPNRVSELLNKYDVASGFMNRFIFGMGKPRRVCVPMMGFGPDYKVIEREFQLINDRLACRGDFDSFTDKAFVDRPWEIGPDQGGLQRMRSWMHEQNQSMQGVDEYTSDLLARRELVMLKLTLIMAINRIAGGDDWKHWTKEDVEAAIGHYPNIEHGWLEMGGRVLDNEDTRFEDWLVERVNATEDAGISRRDLARLVPKSMRKNAKGFNDVVNAMCHNGVFREVELKQGKGKRGIKWIYPNSAAVPVEAESTEPP